MVNKVLLIGNLGADPEARYLSSGAAVCKLSLATTRRWKDKDGQKQEDTQWHTVEVWGKSAEHCVQYLSKGRMVYVEGEIKYEQYEKDGQTKYFTKIHARNVQFLGGTPSGSSNGNSGNGRKAPWPLREHDLVRGGQQDDIPF